MSSRQFRNPSFFNACTPPGCNSSPTMRSGSFRFFSRRMTERFCRARVTARDVPNIPAPTTTTSDSWCSRRRIEAGESSTIAGGGDGEGEESRIRGIALMNELSEWQKRGIVSFVEALRHRCGHEWKSERQYTSLSLIYSIRIQDDWRLCFHATIAKSLLNDPHTNKSVEIGSSTSGSPSFLCRLRGTEIA